MSRTWPRHGIDADAPVLDNARRLLAVRIAEFYAFAPIVAHPVLSRELHEMRIAAKRLRYTLELFQPWLGAESEPLIDRLKSVQEALGALHDHDVRIDVIGDELSRLMVEQSREMRLAIAEATPDELSAIAAAALRPPPDDPRRGLIGLLGREHAARREAYERFREVWDDAESSRMREALVALSIAPAGKAPEEAGEAA
ncbi:MAG: CHAD domain-containing protein [Thermomicrobiales bacterium]|nr:CHAD domain-containing protein [Thermomicrobiales bacterium]